MSPLARLLILALGTFLVRCGPANTSSAASDARAGTPDTLEMMAWIEHIVGIRDTNTDPIFKCMFGRRINYEPKTPSATYVWSLNAREGQKRTNVSFQFLRGDTPKTVRFVVNSDTAHTDVASVHYSDYKTCAVTEHNYRGHHCILWAVGETKDSVKEECLRKHAEICGEGVSLYDKDACANSIP